MNFSCQLFKLSCLFLSRVICQTVRALTVIDLSILIGLRFFIKTLLCSEQRATVPNRRAASTTVWLAAAGSSDYRDGQRAPAATILLVGRYYFALQIILLNSESRLSIVQTTMNFLSRVICRSTDCY